jgi:hypothetical protein
MLFFASFSERRSFYLILGLTLRLCLRVWRGREGKERLKRKKQVEGVEKFGREGV